MLALAQDNSSSIHYPPFHLRIETAGRINMFGLFNKKKPVTMLDTLIVAMYGDPPPPKRADISKAIQLAHNELLLGLIGKSEITAIANDLSSGPIPYSTNDLALSIALNFFKKPELKSQLMPAQIMARLCALEWYKEKKVARMLLESFEEVLYKLYKP